MAAWRIGMSAQRFNAEMGFITRTDIRNPSLVAGWTPWPRRYGIRRLDINGGTDYYANHQGIRVTRTDTVNATLTRNDNAALSVGASREFDLLVAPFRIGPLDGGAGRVHVEHADGELHDRSEPQNLWGQHD